MARRLSIEEKLKRARARVLIPEIRRRKSNIKFLLSLKSKSVMIKAKLDLERRILKDLLKKSKRLN